MPIRIDDLEILKKELHDLSHHLANIHIYLKQIDPSLEHALICEIQARDAIKRIENDISQRKGNTASRVRRKTIENK